VGRNQWNVNDMTRSFGRAGVGPVVHS
jgi:hypothetical protein